VGRLESDMACSSRCKSMTCLGLGFSLFLVAIGCVAFAQVFFGSLKQQLVDNVIDLMHIDNTWDTAMYLGPRGEGPLEKRQFEVFLQSPQQHFEECVQLEGFTAADCPKGLTIAYIVHNITNPDEVLSGAKPIVQEIGPIWTLTTYQPLGADAALLNNNGVLDFRENYTFELHPTLCPEDSPCRSYLEMTVVTVNPLWASVADAGLEAPMLFAMMGGVCMPFDMVTCVGTIQALFQLDVAEAGAFIQAFVTAGQAAILNSGVFLAQAHAAAAGAPGGCTVSSVLLPPAKCASILATAFGTVLPKMILPGLRSVKGHGYGGIGGAAMPIFSKVVVQELLGWQGRTFTDAMTGAAGLSLFAMADLTKDATAQVNSRFGAQGVQYTIGQHCGMDVDCGTNFAWGPCTETDVCKPSAASGYAMKIPGRAWGAEGGFQEFSKAGARTVLYQNFTEIPVLIESEGPTTGKYGGEELETVSWHIASLFRRLENCNGSNPADSRGIDCDGPRNTVYKPVPLGPGTPPVPIYISAERFSNSLFRDPEFMNAGQVASPFNPEDRVEILMCKGDAQLCDEVNRVSFQLETEPETGAMVSMTFASQLNFRIGRVASPIHNVQDTLVPALVIQLSLSTSPKIREHLGKLQSAPALLDMFRYAGIAAGCSSCLLSIIFVLCAFSRLRSIHTKSERCPAPAAPAPAVAQPTLLSSSAEMVSKKPAADADAV